MPVIISIQLIDGKRREVESEPCGPWSIHRCLCQSGCERLQLTHTATGFSHSLMKHMTEEECQELARVLDEWTFTTIAEFDKRNNEYWKQLSGARVAIGLK